MTSRCLMPGCKELFRSSGNGRALFSRGTEKEVWLFVLVAGKHEPSQTEIASGLSAAAAVLDGTSRLPSQVPALPEVLCPRTSARRLILSLPADLCLCLLSAVPAQPHTRLPRSASMPGPDSATGLSSAGCFRQRRGGVSAGEAAGRKKRLLLPARWRSLPESPGGGSSPQLQQVLPAADVLEHPRSRPGVPAAGPPCECLRCLHQWTGTVLLRFRSWQP